MPSRAVPPDGLGDRIVAVHAHAAAVRNPRQTDRVDRRDDRPQAGWEVLDLSERSRAEFRHGECLVLINPLVYINEGSRAALTSSRDMSLRAVYPALMAFSALFLWVGAGNFRRRVIG
jgi:hypothetical protein